MKLEKVFYCRQNKKYDRWRATKRKKKEIKKEGKKGSSIADRIKNMTGGEPPKEKKKKGLKKFLRCSR